MNVEARPAPLSKRTKRRGRRWGVIASLAVATSLMMSGCTLWVDRNFVLQGGATGFYAYIGSNPSSQIQDVYTGICNRNAQCTATILSNFKIGGPDFVRQAWLTAWNHPYSRGEAMAKLNDIAFARYVSGGQRNVCLVLHKPLIPFPYPGGVISYRWQTRQRGNDGCIGGFFANP